MNKVLYILLYTSIQIVECAKILNIVNKLHVQWSYEYHDKLILHPSHDQKVNVILYGIGTVGV